MELKDLYQQLKQYSNFEKNDNSEKFLDVADQLILANDSNCIRELIPYFDDDSEYSWVLESLSRAIEHLDSLIYINELNKNCSLFFPKAVMWICNIYSRIFNNPSYLKLFRSNMHLADKGSLLKLFDLMEAESPHHRELIQELRQELNRAS